MFSGNRGWGLRPYPLFPEFSVEDYVSSTSIKNNNFGERK